MELVVFGILVLAPALLVIGVLGAAVFAAGVLYEKWRALTRHGFGEYTLRVAPREWQQWLRCSCFWNYVLHWFFKFEVVWASNVMLRDRIQPDGLGHSGRTDAPSHLLVAVHPHGLFAVSTLLASVLPPKGLWDRPFASLPTTFVHPVFFALPVVREVFMLLGCLPATRESIAHRLAERSATHTLVSFIVPGGVKETMCPDLYESLEGSQGFQQALGQNWGFLTQAYRAGTPVIPCYSPGERHLFRIWTPYWLSSIRAWMYKRVGFPFPTFFYGPVKPQHALQLHVGTAVVPPVYNAATEAADLLRFKAAYFDALCTVRHSSMREKVE